MRLNVARNKTIVTDASHQLTSSVDRLEWNLKLIRTLRPLKSGIYNLFILVNGDHLNQVQGPQHSLGSQPPEGVNHISKKKKKLNICLHERRAVRETKAPNIRIRQSPKNSTHDNNSA